jgi:hypothetical protein
VYIFLETSSGLLEEGGNGQLVVPIALEQFLEELFHVAVVHYFLL